MDNITEKITNLVSHTKQHPKAVKRIIIIIAMYAAAYIAIIVTFNSLGISRTDIKSYFSQFGYLTGIIFFFTVIITAMTPLPDAPLIATGIILLGVPLGFLLIWSSMLTASMINFSISKYFRKKLFINKYPETTKLVDMFTKDNGIETIVITRMFTFVSFDMVSYAAGLTNMSFPHFFFASLISMLPITINYTFIGAGFAADNLISVVISFGAGGIFAILLGLIIKKWRRKHSTLNNIIEE